MIGAAIRANRCVVIPVVGIEFEGVNLGKQGDKSEIIIIYAVFAQMNFLQVFQLSQLQKIAFNRDVFTVYSRVSHGDSSDTDRARQLIDILRSQFRSVVERHAFRLPVLVRPVPLRDRRL